ncbi:TSUP family transporter [Flavobacterium suzhouense]|uniref:Probable membrane transporter protein n=1 Tax=Flavobacterium suzhouense TaxID=1529638 RepID=A0ABW5NUY1_9FLAO
MANTLFPIYLKTENRRFLIVGGGKVGLEKTNTLLKQNPEVSITIVAPEITSELHKLILWNPNVKSKQREFKQTDLDDADIVIIATNDTELNKHIKALANAKRLLVNAADQPELCDFYLGSIVNKGSLKIAISTNGRSPVLARRLREYFEYVIPNSIENSIDQLEIIRREHTGDLAAKLNDLNKATSYLSHEKSIAKRNKRLVGQISLLFIVFVIGYGLSTIISGNELKTYVGNIPSGFYDMLIVGFFAQLVDGALGMGYGIMCATTMMLFGVKLPAISGSIHTAEVFSSAVSGYTHYRFGNVNKKLLLWLAVPGVLGAVAGAIALIYLGNKYEAFAYAALSIYTMIIGIRLILLALKTARRKSPVKRVGVLGFVGGFMDSFGGGGWGPIVTSTLLAKGRKMNFVVGTVSLAEFFVTLSAAIAFFASLGLTHWHVIVGLIAGGSAAAPLAARLSGKLPRRTALILVAILVIIFSVRVLLKIF